MNRQKKVVLASIISYWIGSVASLLYMQWPSFQGHVHVPFSSFPIKLIFAPFVPFIAASSLFGTPAEAIPLLVIFFLVTGATFLALKFIAFRGPNR